MHQTFYIDIDEEITSIVERLRKSRASEVIIVVPKRALLIQSIINLKLLKKEADELNKDIIIVTQDKFGKLMVEKTGIAVEQRLENIEGEEMTAQDISKDNPKVRENVAVEPQKRGKSKLEQMGSPGFFDSRPNARKKELAIPIGQEKNGTEPEKLTNTELVVNLGGPVRSSREATPGSIGEKNESGSQIRALDIRQKSTDDFEKENSEAYNYLRGLKKNKESERRAGFFKKESLAGKIERDKTDVSDESAEKFAREAAGKIRKTKEEAAYSDINLPKKSWKLLTIFILLILVVILSAGAYLFLPKAKVTLFSNTRSKSIDLEIKADARASSANFEEKIIPARTISFDEEISKNFIPTGSTGASNYKARGTITIYNEYNTANQPLVATTRFLSEEGKLFRLAKGVVVPGLTKVGSEIKPGAIEAEVVADVSGEEYNIGPAKFSIPGFQDSGSEKYTKIYAKSFKPMTGGGKGGELVKTVSQGDIDKAKKEILTEAGSRIKEKVKNELGQDFIILDDGINFGEPTYKISNSVGDISDNFSVSLKLNAKTVAFSEKDIKNLAISILNKNAGEGKMVVEDSISYEFGKTEADFPNDSLEVKVHVTGKTIPAYDLETVEKGILGKNEEEVMAYLKSFPDISSMEIDYSPNFISGRIPLYGSRVEIILDNN